MCEGVRVWRAMAWTSLLSQRLSVDFWPCASDRPLTWWRRGDIGVDADGDGIDAKDLG